jgi:soluble lytic murein transglycosylase-like protein
MLELIATIALAFSLPPDFVISIALIENSQLDPKAIHYNADGSKDRGLMQLNDSWFTRDDWDDPTVNVGAACGYIQLLRSKGLTWYQTAIAYNCGIGKLKNPPAQSVDYAVRVFALWQPSLEYIGR